MHLSISETLSALRAASLQRSRDLSTPAKAKSGAILQQLASAAQLQLSPDTFASARALYENTLDQVKSDARLDRSLVQKKVALAPLNNTTPLQWSLERGDLESAILLADGVVPLLGKLDLSKRGHQEILSAVLGGSPRRVAL